ncbi:MAG: DUF86 domain-containing protein [Aeromicrobium sp.]|uniref:HepT-like ribonuclease domain-containing protein n=1 Tax=Aeromicrobium sp. TaxID=1871063 RepID=UPI00260AD6D7|nr:HepT-like ribonuclease domain-containing protein [Aeromicrobium sp.]MDF1704355.1 DUF86 domain-containing protein [Aeromicrobium sp.]
MSVPHRRALDAAARVVVVCDVLAEFADVGLEAFVADTRTQWAVEMGLIRIGEAVNRLPIEVREAYADQPWRQIVAMRNFAAHQYDDLDPRRVWRTLTESVPEMRDYLVSVVIPGLDDPGGASVL